MKRSSEASIHRPVMGQSDRCLNPRVTKEWAQCRAWPRCRCCSAVVPDDAGVRLVNDLSDWLWGAWTPISRLETDPWIPAREAWKVALSQFLRGSLTEQLTAGAAPFASSRMQRVLQ